MDKGLIFNFESDISGIEIPSQLNNPFEAKVPALAKIAAQEFQSYILTELSNWEHDFAVDKGKMFGVIVVRLKDDSLAFLGTISGKLKGNSLADKFVPSVFDDSTDNYFINTGMSELTAIGQEIESSNTAEKKLELTKIRKEKSFALQQRLFQNYHFLNLSGQTKSVLEIFEAGVNHNPPAAAGECAAPKLLNYALTHKLTPIAIAEFWWGTSPKSEEREHLDFYPACKNKCQPILEFILEDNTLYHSNLS